MQLYIDLTDQHKICNTLSKMIYSYLNLYPNVTLTLQGVLEAAVSLNET